MIWDSITGLASSSIRLLASNFAFMLSNSEAQIIGYKDRAIIYVREDVKPRRRRFSTGHELGNWHHHKGKSFICKPTDIRGFVDEKSKDAERLADCYAADLILPPYMLRPMVDGNSDVNFELIQKIADLFTASITASAIRVLRMTRAPVILVALDMYGRRWQWPSMSVGRLKVRDDIDPRSTSFATIPQPGRKPNMKKEPAHYWFDRRHIEQFDVSVQTMRTIDGEALSLITVLDRKMIEIYG